jgi:hypothetical protein
METAISNEIHILYGNMSGGDPPWRVESLLIKITMEGRAPS